MMVAYSHGRARVQVNCFVFRLPMKLGSPAACVECDALCRSHAFVEKMPHFSLLFNVDCENWRPYSLIVVMTANQQEVLRPGSLESLLAISEVLFFGQRLLQII